jgi:hypothetical protein
MRVFVFKPTNESIGKFDIERAEDLTAAVGRFSETNPLNPYDYLECFGRTWTLVPGPGGLELEEGRVQRPPQQAAGSTSNPPSTISMAGGHATSPGALINRYRAGYQVGTAAIAFVNIIRILGWIAGFFSVVGGMILASQAPPGAGALFLIYGVIGGALQVVVFLFFSVLVSALGQILRSTLDTAVHTSPFLDEKQKAKAMGGQPDGHGA